MLSRTLLTGGSGRLGRELQARLPGLAAPPRSELDLTDEASVAAALARYRPELVIHAAAYTDVAKAELEPARCWQINVAGTRRLVRHLGPAKLIFISTDYVFYGDRGDYHEDDTPGPVRGYYALSKLVAEELARLAERHLIIRTSFRPSRWPHPVAFTDLYTSQDYVDVIADELALAIFHHDQLPFDTIHIATERKSVFELARRRNPEVQPGSKVGAKVSLPDDISLNTLRWQALRARFTQPGGRPSRLIP